MAQRAFINSITIVSGSITGLTLDELLATDLPDTAVTPGSYTNADITVDAQGRITAAANGSGGSSGTVTSIDVSGGTTGLTFSGGPVTTSGTITMAGTLAIANGGTGQTTRADALNALLPVQTGAEGMAIVTNGTISFWGLPFALSDTSGNVSGNAIIAHMAANSTDVTTTGGTYVSMGSGQILLVNPVDLSGADVTGLLAAARSPAYTGDVTKPSGSLATTIASNAVTFAKLADIATDRLIGRDTAGTGDPEALTVGGGLEFTGSGGIQRSALTGDVTASAGSNATTLANSGVTAGDYNTVTVDAKGRVTAGTNALVGCSLTNSSNLSINNVTFTVLTFDTENYDAGGFHSTSSNTGRITIPTGKGGKYLFTCSINWASNATGVREAFFRKNGGAVNPADGALVCQQASTGGNVTAMAFSAPIDCAAGDYIEVLVYQDSGGALIIGGGVGYSPVFTATFLGA